MLEISIGVLISTSVILSAFFLYFLIFPLAKVVGENSSSEEEVLKRTIIKKSLFAVGFVTAKIFLIGLLIYLYKNRELINIRELGGAFLISSFFIWLVIVVFGCFYKPFKK